MRLPRQRCLSAPALKENSLDRPDPRWEQDFDQVLVCGNRFIREVAFFHKETKTLILVDLIENFTDETEDVSLSLKLWWKMVFHMWDTPQTGARVPDGLEG